ncbi:uncharacterized protein [Emydura macquarii macquarii]|uniref:uncharacterized protein n=1 Tax=Emydura macquarii macquarii TaxID=1129001 RepID=UPI00352A4360
MVGSKGNKEQPHIKATGVAVGWVRPKAHPVLCQTLLKMVAEWKTRENLKGRWENVPMSHVLAKVSGSWLQALSAIGIPVCVHGTLRAAQGFVQTMLHSPAAAHSDTAVLQRKEHKDAVLESISNCTIASCEGFIPDRGSEDSQMADSLLNHSWPLFSKRWMKRWSFKRGSECKPCPASDCCSPDAFSPALIAEDEVFFTSMEEEKASEPYSCPVEDSSSPELDALMGDVNSSAEDLLSMDFALPGTEYYRDLGLPNLPAAGVAPGMATLLEQTGQVVPSCYSPEEKPADLGGTLVGIACPGPISCSVQYGEASCHFLNSDSLRSCAAGPPDSTSGGLCLAEQGKGLELQENQESFPTLVRSMSTSRRHSWESPMSPTDSRRRLSLDGSEMASELEQEELEGSLPCLPPRVSLELPTLGLEAWGGGGRTVIQVEIEPLHMNPDPEDTECGSNGKRLRSKSVPSGCDKFSSPRISHSLAVSIPAAEGIDPPVLETIEKDHVAPDHVLIVQQVLQELKQYHGAKQRACAPEGSSESQQNLTWFEFLSNEAEDSGKSDKIERGTKVKRRLSSLRNRVTGSWQKDKGKNKEQQKEREKEKEPKELKERWKGVSGHQLVPGTFSSYTSCSLCAKPLANKNSLQCLSEYGWYLAWLSLTPLLT